MADIKARLLALKAPSEILRTYFYKAELTVDKFCTACGHIGVPLDKMGGRREVELTLWGIFVLLSAGFLIQNGVEHFVTEQNWFHSLLHVLHHILSRACEMLFVISMAYSLFRLSSQQQICSKCQGATVIPADSPRAKEINKGH